MRCRSSVQISNYKDATLKSGIFTGEKFYPFPLGFGSGGNGGGGGNGGNGGFGKFFKTVLGDGGGGGNGTTTSTSLFFLTSLVSILTSLVCLVCPSFSAELLHDIKVNTTASDKDPIIFFI